MQQSTVYRPWEVGYGHDDFRNGTCREIEVVGESNYTHGIRQIRQQLVADDPSFYGDFLAVGLACEPQNPYDRNAVVVSAAGIILGYVVATQARNLSPRLARVGGTMWAIGRLGYRSDTDIAWVECWVRKGEP